jgi:hypothetical protein
MTGSGSGFAGGLLKSPSDCGEHAAIVASADGID